MLVPSENNSAEDVHEGIAEVARRLHDGGSPEAGSVIQQIVDYAVSTIPGADYAGVTVVSRGTKVTTAATTHSYPALLDAIQEGHQQGPCLASMWRHDTIRVDDLTTETRWPFYRDDALSVTPIRSIMSFRLFTADHTMGALNVFADRPAAFDDEAESLGYVIAAHTALAWDTVRREGQFRSALASRDLIGQAKGILMVRFDIDAVRAFELLRRISQGSNTPLIDVARRVVSIRGWD